MAYRTRTTLGSAPSAFGVAHEARRMDAASRSPVSVTRRAPRGRAASLARPGRSWRSVGNTRAVWVSTRAVAGALEGASAVLATPDHALARCRAPARGRSAGASSGQRADDGDPAVPEPAGRLAATPPRLPRCRGCPSPPRLRAPYGEAPGSSSTADRGWASGGAPRSPRPPQPGSG